MAKKNKRSRLKSKKLDTLKTKLTKSQLIAHLVSYVEEQEEDITAEISSKDMKKLITATMDGLTDTIQRSIRPGGIGTFILSKTFKVSLKAKKAIKKGTMVRSPATGGVVPSKGRPASKRVKMNPLVNLKKAASGEI